MDYPPFFRKFSLNETGEHKMLKTCVLASIESLKHNGGYFDYDDRGQAENQISIMVRLTYPQNSIN